MQQPNLYGVEHASARGVQGSLSGLSGRSLSILPPRKPFPGATSSRLILSTQERTTQSCGAPLLAMRQYSRPSEVQPKSQAGNVKAIITAPNPPPRQLTDIMGVNPQTNQDRKLAVPEIVLA